MRGIFSVVIAILLCLSCKKADMTTFISIVLTHHMWYPYKLRIITDDTVTTSNVVRGVVIPPSNTYLIHLDTTFILDQCMQNVSYKFQSNGRLFIKNPCYSGNNSIDTIWSTLSNSFIRFISISYPKTSIYYNNHFNYIYFPVDSTYSYWSSLGNVTWVNDNQFVYHIKYFWGFVDKGTSYTDTIHKFSSHMFTTYRSQ